MIENINLVLKFIILFFVSLAVFMILRMRLKKDAIAMTYIKTINQLTKEVDIDMKKKVLFHICMYMLAFVMLIIFTYFLWKEYNKIEFLGLASSWYATALYVITYLIYWKIYKK